MKIIKKNKMKNIKWHNTVKRTELILIFPNYLSRFACTKQCLLNRNGASRSFVECILCLLKKTSIGSSNVSGDTNLPKFSRVGGYFMLNKRQRSVFLVMYFQRLV